MDIATIEYRDKPSWPWFVWAQREGKKEEVRDSARGLLRSMRKDEGLRQPAVRISWPGGKVERVRASA